MFIVDRFLHGLINATGSLVLLLQRFLAGLLAGAEGIANALEAVADSLWQFALEIGFFLGQIALTLLRVGLILAPGGGLIAAGLIDENLWLSIPGGTYLLLCLAIGFAYRGSGATGPLAGKVPANWMAYFPYSWTQYEHLAPALSRLLAAHGEIKDSIAKCGREHPVGQELARVDFEMHRYLRKVRRGIKARVRSDKKFPKRIEALSLEVDAAADRFSELSKWAVRAAKHPAFSSVPSGERPVPSLGSPAGVSEHIETLRVFLQAMDSVEEEAALSLPQSDLEARVSLAKA